MKLIKPKIKYVILSMILVGTIIGLRMFFKPHADINKLKVEFKLDAADLLSEFGKDETSATTKYSEKVLEITGKLVAKSKLQNGTDLLILENEMEGISCQIDSSWAFGNQPIINGLETGNLVTVKGICKGYLMEIKVSPAVVIAK